MGIYGVQEHQLAPRPTDLDRKTSTPCVGNGRCRVVQIVRIILACCVRRSRRPDACGVNWLVRGLPADWPARCPASTHVPNREPVPLGRRAEHTWIADSLQALHRRTAGSALADQCAPTDAHRQGWCGRGHVPTPSPQQYQATQVCRWRRGGPATWFAGWTSLSRAEEIGAFAQLLFVCPQELVPFSHAEKMNL